MFDWILLKYYEKTGSHVVSDLIVEISGSLFMCKSNLFCNKFLGDAKSADVKSILKSSASIVENLSLLAP